ncbi:helix-turn-helix transcriptional regulator [Hyunsoonleella pacifica]|uniref:Helix-turn-helix domain-containing protein n=1 Tax=Hyunsoonleella pacifica TaxID=1080224 RepID=A0A4Q9FMN4_9FLAO|nr:helix-turn-helix transcriptional regulator [Hyunsoonleella pacifica]TBN15471.1 helix-turn-helix domain-containing protein [Hyunsoonleella pacifica]GGD24378.1 AraC family transcriptional regulator [Hyunsoonleella pacifica]
MKKIPIKHLNHFHKSSNKQEVFKIRKLEDLFEGKNMIIKHHRHDFYFILAMKKGYGSHEIDFTSYKVSDYSFFIVRPGQIHKLNLRKDGIGFIIQFDPEFYYSNERRINTLLQKIGANNFYQCNQDIFSRLNTLLNTVFSEYQNKPEQYIEVIKSNLKILFIELTRLKSTTIQSQNTKDIYIQDRLEEFLKLLEINISTHKQVSQYADMLHLSGYQLNSITKQTLAKTASKLINEQIILESKRYLLATTNQINHIAHYLGYEDVSYFIRFFKKHTGLSPRVFRENFK